MKTPLIHPLRHSRLVRGSLGFSMIEVVLALGILSFAIVPMMALITGSLQTYRSAMSDMVGRQIMSEIAANAQQSPVDDLIGGSTVPLYFDGDGQPVNSLADPLRVYTANVSASASGNPLGSGNLIQVRIRVEGMSENDLHETSVLVFPQG